MEITNLNIKLPSVNLNDSESKLTEITNKSNAKSDKNFKKVLDNKISSKESAIDVKKDINYDTKNVQNTKTTNEVQVKENTVPVKDVPLDKVDVKEIDVNKTPTLDEAYVKDVDTSKTPVDEAYALMDLIISIVSDSNEVQAIEENMKFNKLNTPNEYNRKEKEKFFKVVLQYNIKSFTLLFSTPKPKALECMKFHCFQWH